MAILKHISGKNMDYGETERYLTYQYNELAGKPVLDAAGRMIPRMEYLIDGIGCTPDTFAIECLRTNRVFHKNTKRGDIKTHHYIISFDPKDTKDHGQTLEKAQEIGLAFAKRNFPGHQILVCTHPGGHNGTGNIHVHIVLNSVRSADTEKQLFTERPRDTKAGYKHHVTKKLLQFYKKDLMNTCRNAGLYQVNCLAPAGTHITNEEYRAKQQLNARNTKATKELINGNASIVKVLSAYNLAYGQGGSQTGHKDLMLDTLRKSITAALRQSRNLEEFCRILQEKYGITVSESRGRFSYLLKGQKKPVTSRRLGKDYSKEKIIESYDKNKIAEYQL
jgi:hypothetical protein